jgi:hypothetical protein
MLAAVAFGAQKKTGDCKRDQGATECEEQVCESRDSSCIPCLVDVFSPMKPFRPLLPVVKSGIAARQKLPTPGKLYRSGPAHQGTE